MALYCSHEVHHRGRLYNVPLRYGCHDGAGSMKQIKGKLLKLSPKDRRKISARATRAHAREGCFVGYGDDF